MNQRVLNDWSLVQCVLQKFLKWNIVRQIRRLELGQQVRVRLRNLCIYVAVVAFNVMLKEFEQS